MKTLHRQTFGQGRPLVLIHGWAMHSGVWGEFAECLAKDFRITLVDLPGHGLSPVWSRWTLDSTARALADLVTGPALWLGWSLGGQVALELARRSPAKVEGLILVATNPKFIAADDWPGIASETFESFIREADTGVALDRFLSLCCLGAAGAAGILRRLRLAWESYPAPIPRVLRQGLEILHRADLRPSLADIACEVCVAAGREDRLVPVAVARRLAESLPQARLAILDDAGHAPFLSHPEKLAALVRELAA